MTFRNLSPSIRTPSGNFLKLLRCFFFSYLYLMTSTTMTTTSWFPSRIKNLNWNTLQNLRVCLNSITLIVLPLFCKIPCSQTFQPLPIQYQVEQYAKIMSNEKVMLHILTSISKYLSLLTTFKFSNTWHYTLPKISFPILPLVGSSLPINYI